MGVVGETTEANEDQLQFKVNVDKMESEEEESGSEEYQEPE